MNGDADVAAAARLFADPTRCSFVLAVLERGPLPATELAARAGVTPSTASEHLARLVDAGVLRRSPNGRQRHYSLGDHAVADAVEALARIAPQPAVRSLAAATRSEQLRYARTCYDHLAGALGVVLAQALVARGALVRDGDGFLLGNDAGSGLAPLGIELATLSRQRRPLLRGCRDWSERELHVAGALGAAIAQRLFDLGWIERRDGNRSVAVTKDGAAGLEQYLRVDVGSLAGGAG